MISLLDLNTTLPPFENTTVTHQYNHTNESFYGPVFPSYIRTTATVLCSIIMGIGVLGNVMVPLVIFKSKDMRNSTNIFLMNLSLADLMVLLVCTPTVLVEVNSRPETWVLGEEMCKAVPFIEMAVAHASVLTILAISFERYYAICEPLKAGYVCTKTRAVFICGCAWTFAAILTSPMLIISEYRLVEYKDEDKSLVPACLTEANTFWRAFFFYMSISIFFLVPLVILLALYALIAVRLMADPGIKGTENYNHRARSQIVLMLGTVVLCFFLCLMPFRLFTLWLITVSPPAVMDLGIERYYNLLYFCRTMLYLNSAVNPILYNLMSSKFREGFMRLCGVNSGRIIFGRRRRWGLTNSLNTTSTSLYYSNSRRDKDFVGSARYSYKGSPELSLNTRRNRSSLQDEFSPILKNISRKNTMISQISNSPQRSRKNSLNSVEEFELQKYTTEKKVYHSSSDSCDLSDSESQREKRLSFKDVENRKSAALSEYDNLEKIESLTENGSMHVEEIKIELKPPDRGKKKDNNLSQKISKPNSCTQKKFNSIVFSDDATNDSRCKLGTELCRSNSIRRSILKTSLQKRLSSNGLNTEGATKPEII